MKLIFTILSHSLSLPPSSLSLPPSLQGESSQVYQAAAVAKEEGKTASVQSMIQQVIEAFNQLNVVAGDILEHAQPLAHEVGVCGCVWVCVCVCVCVWGGCVCVCVCVCE